MSGRLYLDLADASRAGSIAVGATSRSSGTVQLN
jgi:hypothetical protein